MSRHASELVHELTTAGVAGVTIGKVDLNGIPRSRTVPVAGLRRAAEIGVGMSPLFAVFDSLDTITYAHRGIATPSGDVRLFPVLEGLVALAGQPALAWAPGRILTADGEPWPYDPRTVLQRQVGALAAAGFTALAGYELEFTVYRGGGLALSGPGYSPHTLIDEDAFFGDVLRDCAANGLTIGQLHAEYGTSQVELSLAATDPLRAADQQLLARQTLHATAHRHGVRLSFAPLPALEGAGNGWHVHTSLWRGDHNLLGDGPGGYVAGLLRDLPAVAAIAAPSVGSLARRRPGYFAGAYACWGVQNREAPVRYVPGTALLGRDAANVELKCSDASGNPYLALAAVLAAGLVGVLDDAALPEPVQRDPGTLTDGERAAAGIVELPTTPVQQEAALTGNPRIAAVLGPELLDAFVQVRRSDAAAAGDRPTEDVLADLRWRY